MNSYQTKTDQILRDAVVAIDSVATIHDLEVVKSHYLGKKGELNGLLRQLGQLAEVERPAVGQVINQAKEQLINLFDARLGILNQAKVTASLNQEASDITLPPRGQDFGSSHPLTEVRRILEDFFIHMGFVVVEGPEIESEFYNFAALNIPSDHPARTAHDTFYFDDNVMLRSQTSTVQIHAMQNMSPPLRIISPGKVFRRDNDATHSPMFHQLEMLMVDEHLNFAKLKWLVAKFIRFFFQREIEYRFRPSYFPFTEPSAEVDVKWQVGDTWRWLELGGCGVVHPNVLKAVNIDSARFRGLAFGFGIERLAMVYYGISDIRMLFENDLQFLRQF